MAMDHNNVGMYPCMCILQLPLSSLRSGYAYTCQYFNQNGWEELCQHFLSYQMLTHEDIIAVTSASRLRTQTEEMVLRLERKMLTEQNINFTIGQFLHHVHNVFGMPHIGVLVQNFMNTHIPNCPLLQDQAAPLNHYPLPLPMSPPPQDNIHCAKSPLSPQPNRINKLSENPYLRITKHPTGSVVTLGESLMLRCLAESGEAISYSWKKDGKLLPGESDKIFMIPETEKSDEGDYQCVVATKYRQSESKICRVTVQGEEPCTEPSSSLTASVPDSLYFATDKLALLIANERYAHSPRLASASNDVKALAGTLRDELNFKTVALVNLNLNEMNKAVELFCNQLTFGAYCVVYLAGHGFENDGQCYIVPTDAPDGYTSQNCFSVKKLIHDIRTSCDLSLSVFLLDVCRKRNINAVSVPQPDNNIKKSGNFVVSFATMEHGMAYEVRGQDLGVYVTSLQKYLNKDKRITRVLELVHMDISKNSFTRDVQQPEFKSNMYEDRKLTDIMRITLSSSQATEVWRVLHEPIKPTLFIFESCGVEVELYRKNVFSNVLLIETKVADKGHTEVCDVSFALRRRQNSGTSTLSGDDQATGNRTRFEIENLQRLFGNVLYLTICLKYKLHSSERIIQERWDDSITIPFVSWWNS